MTDSALPMGESPASPRVGGRPLHPLPIRIMHWLNAVAMIIMIGSGWLIYNDEVIFGWLQFPRSIVIGLEAQHALQWHFLGMWILGLNGIAYLVYGVATGRFRRKLFPIRIGELVANVREALSLKLEHDDITKYNAVQKILYIGIILVIFAQILTGLAIWKPVQLQGLLALFYDFQTARLLHFLGMAAICFFLLIHVTLALLVPKTLVAMVTGGPRAADGHRDGDAE